MDGALETEDDFIKLVLENVKILATQEETVYEKQVREGQEVYTPVGTRRAVTPASLQAINATLNSKVIQRYFSEQRKSGMVHTREALAAEKALEITDEST